MRVADILMLLPNSESLLATYGLSCFNCSANETENLMDGCRTHGFTDEDISDLVTDLNIMLDERPARPQVLTLTTSAATQLKEMLTAENKAGWGLLVALDANGGFAMEVVEKPQTGDHTFKNADVPDVPLFASGQTLFAIGGSTIDFRDGRFKLDLPEDMAKVGGCACENEGECGCY